MFIEAAALGIRSCKCAI